MDLGGHEAAEIPLPMLANFAPTHEAAKLKMLTGGGNGLTGGINGPLMEEVRPPVEVKMKRGVKYRECMKNHAASLGGHATDGCGEFMPCGDEGTLEALKCAACDCHRNFHRREVDGEPSCDCQHGRKDRKTTGPLISPQHAPLALTPNTFFSRSPSQMIMALRTGPPESDDQEGGLVLSPSTMKKRFRTKFTVEQKDKMHEFAEKLGWRIQKHDEAAVQQFCSDIGVKRHVLKVWMHNNKSTMGKKL